MIKNLNEFYKYPAVISYDLENGDLCNINFIDFDNLIVHTKNEEEIENLAEEMLKEIVVKYIDEEKDLPLATHPRNIKLENNEYIEVFKVNMLILKKEYFDKKVKKNCTLPLWLSKMAEKEGVNFSRVLTEGLKKELGLIKDF